MRKVFPSRSFQVLRVLFVYFLVFPSKTVWQKRILATNSGIQQFHYGLLGPMLYLIYPFFCLFSKFIFRFSNFQTGSQQKNRSDRRIQSKFSTGQRLPKSLHFSKCTEVCMQPFSIFEVPSSMHSLPIQHFRNFRETI